MPALMRCTYAHRCGRTSAHSRTPASRPRPPTGRGRGARPRRTRAGTRPNFPQQQRPLADAAVLARGKGLYDSNCAACHGIDLRGGQQGGPNLLRSQTLLRDKAGELVIPIVRGGRPTPPAGMPPMPRFRFPTTTSKRSRSTCTAC